MRRSWRFSFLLIPLGLLLALMGCSEPLSPIGALNVTSWPLNTCGLYAAPTLMATQDVQLVDCAAF